MVYSEKQNKRKTNIILGCLDICTAKELSIFGFPGKFIIQVFHCILFCGWIIWNQIKRFMLYVQITYNLDVTKYVI